MSSQPSLIVNRRLESLDALRGLTIAAMLLVNNPGSWSHIYPPLEHAVWNGWTLTDLIFPFFLFMVGMSMMFSFPRRLSRGATKQQLYAHVLRRAAALILLGWWGSSWSAIMWPAEPVGLWGAVLRLGYVGLIPGAVVLLAGTDRMGVWRMILAGGITLFLTAAVAMNSSDPLLARLSGLRIPGVLVRIAWCYALASAVYFLTPSRRAIAWWIGGALGIYALWMMLVPVPGFGVPDLSRGFPTANTPADERFSNWAFYIDYHVFGTHTWSVRQIYDAAGNLIWSFDPEGLVSTIPATTSVLFGVLAGQWVRRTDRSEIQKLNGLFVAASWLMLAGLVVSIWMPINKRLWTSSYTIFTAGMAMLTLGVLYHAIDIRGHRDWAYPLLAYGRNAIFSFVASGMMATTLINVHVGDRTLKGLIYGHLPGGATFASLLFGLLFVGFWAIIAWLLDRRKIYFKV